MYSPSPRSHSYRYRSRLPKPCGTQEGFDRRSRTSLVYLVHPPGCSWLCYSGLPWLTSSRLGKIASGNPKRPGSTSDTYPKYVETGTSVSSTDSCTVFRSNQGSQTICLIRGLWSGIIHTGEKCVFSAKGAALRSSPGFTGDNGAAIWVLRKDPMAQYRLEVIPHLEIVS
jgi:hypothetical protein